MLYNIAKVRNMNLSDLAIAILRLEDKPISKVRFAKTIYFVHKELIRLGKSSPVDIEYIRMPLGPVPFGFMTLSIDNPEILVEKIFTGLAYNTSQYTLRKKKVFRKSINNELDGDIASVLGNLRPMTTAELVELSHDDKSWKDNVNGHVYTISKDDLKKEIPHRRSVSGRSGESDDQRLQASLVQGMIDDIVSESTDLEHPTNDPAKTRNP